MPIIPTAGTGKKIFSTTIERVVLPGAELTLRNLTVR
jgi:hypothetical protein